jgi:AbrB family looped-hinge helix DNA binding protein
MYRTRVYVGEKTLVSAGADGRIVLPDAARRALELDAGSQVECEVRDDSVVLRKASETAPEDVWLYQPGVVPRIKQAAQRASDGRRWRVTEDFLRELAARADAAHAADHEFSQEALAAALADAERDGEVERVGLDPSGAAGAAGR